MSIRTTLVFVFLLAFCGCARWYTPRHPMPIAEVVQLGKSDTAPPLIIKRIRESGTTYALRGSDFAKLKADGVPDPVLDYLQQSFVDDLDLQTRYWVTGEASLGACSWCYPQPLDVDKLESGYGVVPAPPPGRYEAGRPMGTPDWVPYPQAPRSGAPISVSDIAKMTKDGTPEGQIIDRINHSPLTHVIGVGGTFTIHTQPVAGLSGSELAMLHGEGVGYPVLDALQGQFLAQFIETERLRYQNIGQGSIQR
ncbi:MAG TPA: hypothetical protein VMH26_03160 [Burkholderiales bacterium]|nr:hypothetical protein [Burkholderiales bacterium]